MHKQVLSITLAASLSLTACAGYTVNGVDTTSKSSGDYCQQNPAICIAAGVLVVGGVGVIVNHYNKGSTTTPPALPSDERLKQDIRPVAKMNGIHLYAFRYRGDERVFVGVMAQDLLKDKRFSEAATLGKDGYYRVDYAKLGLSVMNADEMLSAGNTAVNIASLRRF